MRKLYEWKESIKSENLLFEVILLIPILLKLTLSENIRKFMMRDGKFIATSQTIDAMMNRWAFFFVLDRPIRDVLISHPSISGMATSSHWQFKRYFNIYVSRSCIKLILSWVLFQTLTCESLELYLVLSNETFLKSYLLLAIW